MSWIASLKTGDPVVVGGPGNYREATVGRVAGSFVTVEGRRFSRKTGKQTGKGVSRWDRVRIQEPTKELLLQVRLETLGAAIRVGLDDILYALRRPSEIDLIALAKPVRRIVEIDGGNTEHLDAALRGVLEVFR